MTDKFTPKRIAELKAAKSLTPAHIQMNKPEYIEWLIEVAPDYIDDIAVELSSDGRAQIIIAAQLEAFIDAIDRSEPVYYSNMIAAHRILWEKFGG